MIRASAPSRFMLRGADKVTVSVVGREAVVVVTGDSWSHSYRI